MNDRFKFRCWDKENKCMHYPTRYSNFNIVYGVIVKIESYLTRNGVYRGKGVAYEFDDAVIMQCTGLKDKNGKLVYEGDVVLLPDEEDVPYVVNYDIDRAMFVVESQILHLCCNFDNYYGKEIEVIGNIYENPELLKECENE